jgi:hypothetical protein
LFAGNNRLPHGRSRRQSENYKGASNDPKTSRLDTIASKTLLEALNDLRLRNAWADGGPLQCVDLKQHRVYRCAVVPHLTIVSEPSSKTSSGRRYESRFNSSVDVDHNGFPPSVVEHLDLSADPIGPHKCSRSSNHYEKSGVSNPQSSQNTEILTHMVIASVEMDSIFFSECLIESLWVILAVVVCVRYEKIITK